jgi:hypothetical protein
MGKLRLEPPTVDVIKEVIDGGGSVSQAAENVGGKHDQEAIDRRL